MNNGDPVSFGRLVYTYSRATLENLVHSATSMFNHYKGKVMKSEL